MRDAMRFEELWTMAGGAVLRHWMSVGPDRFAWVSSSPDGRDDSVVRGHDVLTGREVFSLALPTRGVLLADNALGPLIGHPTRSGRRPPVEVMLTPGDIQLRDDGRDLDRDRLLALSWDGVERWSADLRATIVHLACDGTTLFAITQRFTGDFPWFIECFDVRDGGPTRSGGGPVGEPVALGGALFAPTLDGVGRFRPGQPLETVLETREHSSLDPMLWAAEGLLEVQVADPQKGNALWLLRPDGRVVMKVLTERWAGNGKVLGELYLRGETQGDRLDLVARDLRTGEVAWTLPGLSSANEEITVEWCSGALVVGVGCSEVVAIDPTTRTVADRAPAISLLAVFPAHQLVLVKRVKLTTALALR